jgi:hypothetical protein
MKALIPLPGLGCSEVYQTYDQKGVFFMKFWILLLIMVQMILISLPAGAEISVALLIDCIRRRGLFISPFSVILLYSRNDYDNVVPYMVLSGFTTEFEWEKGRIKGMRSKA